jgi:hypothetical protein
VFNEAFLVVMPESVHHDMIDVGLTPLLCQTNRQLPPNLHIPIHRIMRKSNCRQHIGLKKFIFRWKNLYITIKFPHFKLIREGRENMKEKLL